MRVEEIPKPFNIKTKDSLRQEEYDYFLF